MSAAVSFGQNFNPTVEVTNTYQGNSSEVHKPQLEMNVPDSLLRFDLDFDYEVFAKPYQGAYSFKPYTLDMRPGKDAWRGRSLYLKAGAGYSLRPRLEFVFSPEQSGPFQMSVYASHKSYFGRYHGITPDLKDDGIYRLNKSGDGFGGYDALTAAGFDGLYSWDKTILSFGVGYYGLAAKDTVISRSYNAFDFNARVRSNNDAERYFLYDIALNGRIANDRLDYKSFNFPGNTSVEGQNESWFILDGQVGPVFDSRRSFIVGFTGETASYGKFYDGSAGRIALTPSYRLKSGRWNLNLGVRLEMLFRSEASDTLFFRKMSGGKGQVIYPDVHVDFLAGKNVTLFAEAKGGSRLDTYSSKISNSHHLNPSFLVSKDAVSVGQLVDNTVEKLNARIGVRGSAASAFWYEVNGGVGIYGNLAMESGLFLESGFVPAVEYSDANILYANALLGWKAERFCVDAQLRYRNLSFQDSKADNLGFGLPAYSGFVKAAYNITSRLYAGISVEAASWREGKCASAASEEFVKARVPGYVDLGLNCGYRFNRKLEFWLESGNLLCQTVQRNPFYAEKGLWVTGGIALNL